MNTIEKLTELEKLKAIAVLKKERERVESLLNNVRKSMDLFGKYARKTAEYYNLEQEGLKLEKELHTVDAGLAELIGSATESKSSAHYNEYIVPNAHLKESLSVIESYEVEFDSLEVLTKMHDDALQMAKDYEDDELHAKLKKERYIGLAHGLTYAIQYTKELQDEN